MGLRPRTPHVLRLKRRRCQMRLPSESAAQTLQTLQRRCQVSRAIQTTFTISLVDQASPTPFVRLVPLRAAKDSEGGIRQQTVLPHRSGTRSRWS